MSYLIIGALVAWLLYRSLGRRALPRNAGWRVAAGAAAVVTLAAAGFVAVRGGWEKSVILALAALLLVLGARWPRAARPQPMARPVFNTMGAGEARAVLGVGPDAGPDEIKAAYGRLIRRVHPDQGGAAGLAAHLNQARDVLLKS